MQALYEETAQETRQAQDAAEQEAQVEAKRGQRAKKPSPNTFAQRVAGAFEAMARDPQDPEVKACL